MNTRSIVAITALALLVLVIIPMTWNLVREKAPIKANPPPILTGPEIAEKAFASTVILVMEDNNGQNFKLGSGFVIRDGYIATNLHVVEDAVTGYAKFIGSEKRHTVEYMTAVDPKQDLVILKISAHHSQALTLGNSDIVQVGEPVYAIGNPEGLEGTLSQGIVSGIRVIDESRRLQITAPISKGSSGGPVLNEKGEVIGVSSAFLDGGQNLNFAIPSNYLKTLLAMPSSPRPLFDPDEYLRQRRALAEIEAIHSESSNDYILPIQRIEHDARSDKAVYTMACEAAGKSWLRPKDPGLLRFAQVFNKTRKTYPFDTDQEITLVVRQLHARWINIYRTVTFYSFLEQLASEMPPLHVPPRGLRESLIVRVAKAGETIDARMQAQYAEYLAKMKQDIQRNKEAARKQGQALNQQLQDRYDAQAARARALLRWQQSEVERIKLWPRWP